MQTAIFISEIVIADIIINKNFALANNIQANEEIDTQMMEMKLHLIFNNKLLYGNADICYEEK